LGFSRVGNSSFVKDFIINNQVVHFDSSGVWDVEQVGFYYQLFFELWLYDVTLQSFEFHNRFVGIWLNMTS